MLDWSDVSDRQLSRSAHERNSHDQHIFFWLKLSERTVVMFEVINDRQCACQHLSIIGLVFQVSSGIAALAHHGAVPRLQDSWTLKCTGHYRLGTQNFKNFFGKLLVHSQLSEPVQTIGLRPQSLEYTKSPGRCKCPVLQGGQCDVSKSTCTQMM